MKSRRVILCLVAVVLVAVAMLAPCVAGANTSVQRANLANYAGRDHLGRELVSADEAGAARTNRQVALFYYLW
ncbi:MAG: hypothetical protein IJQ65_08595, partial [Kiritimatiellae bacterium]|nr:hypothetical protein [Kiritimatiellia bacterium]